MALLAALLTALLFLANAVNGAGLLLRRGENTSRLPAEPPKTGSFHSSSATAGAEHIRDHAQTGAKTDHRSAAEKARDKAMHTCLEGKRIVFVGPSTAKFDYWTLAYFAEYGIWPAQDQVVYGAGAWGPNYLNEMAVTHGGIPLPPQVTTPQWKAGCQAPVPGTCETAFRYSNHVLNGHETCDCYEFGSWSTASDIYNSTENRVWTNGNKMVAYFQYMGDIVPPRGTFDITPLLAQPPAPVQQTCPVGQFPGTWSWAKTLPDFLRNVVRHSNPTHVVVSSAFWPITPTNTAFWADVAAAGAESVMDSKGQVIWKTTPQRIHESLPHRYTSPRVDMTPFAAKGWQVFPAGQIIETFQGAWPNDAVFLDFAHLRPHSQCHMMQAFLATHVCPGVPVL